METILRSSSRLKCKPGFFSKVTEPTFAGGVARLCGTDLRRLKALLEAGRNGSHLTTTRPGTSAKLRRAVIEDKE